MSSANSSSRIVGVAFLGFMGLGMSSGLLGLAWPSIRQAFGLSLDAVNVLYLFPTIIYSLVSFYIGRLMARFGSGTILLAGTIIVGVCLFGIATSSSWVWVIVFSTISGLGSGILDAGLNFYVATYHSPQQMSWLHACFGVGITVGPLIMTFVLQKQLGWQVGYAIVGIVIVAVILLFGYTRRRWHNGGLHTAENKPVHRVEFAKSMRTPVIWLSMATFFTYVGLEIGIGQWAYTLLTQSRNISPEVAGPWVSLYWGAFTGGRFLFGVIANRFKIEHILRGAMLGAIVGVALFWWNPSSTVGLIGLVVTGAAQAPIFPLLMSATARRVGVEHAENAISMQMGAVGIGAALLPGLIGTLGKNFGLETMAACFVVAALVVFICNQLTGVVRARQPALIQAEG